EALPVFDLEVEVLLHGGTARIAEDRTVAERAGSEFHAALEPANGFTAGQSLGGRVEHIVARHGGKTRADGGQKPVNVHLVQLRTEVGTLHAVDRVRHCAFLALMHMVDRERGAGGAASVARRRLYPDIAKVAVQEHLPISDAVERDATGETQVVRASLVCEAAGKAQDRIFQDRLN